MSRSATDLDAFRREARAWLEANLLPRRASDALRSAHGVTSEQLAADRARQQKLYDAGYAGLTIPSGYGGRGLSPAHERVWNEESARYALPMPGGVAYGVTLGIVLPTLLAYASESQKTDWIPRMMRAEEIWVQLLSEPDAGSDLAGITTRATRQGERWVITGTKVWSSGALSADFGICLARTNWDVPKHRGLTWFKVPLRDPRVLVRPIREINGGAEFCEEFLDDVAVDDDMVIGEIDGGWPIANAMLGFERHNIGVNAGEKRPAGRRRLPPDLVELADHHGLAADGPTRQLIARVASEEYVLGLLARRVVTGLQHAAFDPALASVLKLGQGIHQPARACAAMAIGGFQTVAWKLAESAGEGAAVNYLNGRIMAIAGGTNQIQRNIIAERILGLPREQSDDRSRSFREVQEAARGWGRHEI